jgi:hypothetical protein
MTAAAYLRVYLPADAAGRLPRHTVTETGSTPILVRSEFGVYYESVRDDAFVAEHGGRRYVCPRTPRLRMLEGLIAFRNASSAPTSTMLVPDRLVDRASHELEQMQRRRPTLRSHILTSPFYIPLRWFGAFSSTERELIQGDDGLTIRYRTILERAVERLERSVEILDQSGFEDAIVDQVRDVLRWMERFPSDSLLELDYGGVARLFSDAELALDESAADVAASIDALEHEDYDKAGTHYATAASRWAAAQALTYAN